MKYPIEKNLIDIRKKMEKGFKLNLLIPPDDLWLIVKRYNLGDRYNLWLKIVRGEVNPYGKPILEEANEKKEVKLKPYTFPLQLFLGAIDFTKAVMEAEEKIKANEKMIRTSQGRKIIDLSLKGLKPLKDYARKVLEGSKWFYEDFFRDVEERWDFEVYELNKKIAETLLKQLHTKELKSRT